MSYEILDLAAGKAQLAGKTLGSSIYDKLIDPAVQDWNDDTVLVLGLKGAKAVTGSFFKATWLRLHLRNEAAVPTAVAYLSDDARTDFDIFLRSYRLPGIEAVDWDAKGISHATLHGHIEDPAWSALRALLRKPGATAPELHDGSREDVSPTAWTNRLNDLHRHGLVLREKAGRAWKFFPIAKEIQKNG